MGQRLSNLLHIVWFAAVVYLWNTKGRYHFNYDTISVALTSLEIILVVGGIFGFTYFRFVAEKKASEVAKEAAELEAKATLKEQLPSMVAQEVRANMKALKSMGPEDVTEEQLTAMMQALSVKDDDNGK
ncbi:MAG: hypothetical protein VR78_19015 [Hoeflea sp. BRH_c9]|nr:MAG: hypothetical protein VR78_19015 [Hoeflea sp. BRH_c9]